MKLFIITLLSIMSTTMYSCSSNNDEIQESERQTNFELTAIETQDLVFLREEEKLARDVYLYAYDKYEHQIFYNISQSEQTHMNRVLDLLNTYGIEDPVINERGSFSNQTLQQLYIDLTAQVDISLTEALKVGATIEDLDINDIATSEANTSRSDILQVYSNLECGSRNHIRSFTYQLERNGITYIPQYISQEDFNAIIEYDKERCGRNW